ncbi:hypothetical protein DXG03_004516 [Asterophora parasitica]|uniref:Apple domain-containing protein n=1 Tax=Asterophora parasitica TaxID=117018 RepID=A0A9P7G715_9AGAR|nr:hypothetical protein DXG03_004516 [Asterophora parasitica]
MRFAALFAAASLAISGVAGTPFTARDASTSDSDSTVSVNVNAVLGSDLSAANFYGAPYPPWHPRGNPGWYFGDHGYLYPHLPCLEGLLCAILRLLPLNFLHCPVKPPPKPPVNDGFTPTFRNLTGATQAGDYLTFGLVDTVAQCKAMCKEVQNCKFVNTYHDVNGKGGSTQLTCSLFSSCHDASDAINKGGQSQPDGSINYIRDSDGYCRK